MVAEYTKGDYPHGPCRIHGRRCRNLLNADKSVRTSGDGGILMTCCSQHWNILQQGKTLVDYQGRIWRWSAKKGLRITGTTNPAHSDEEAMPEEDMDHEDYPEIRYDR